MEDRHLDARACVAVACGVASLIVVFSSPVGGIFFGTWAWILGCASVIAVDEPASPRTRRVAFLAVTLALPSTAALVLLALFGFFAPPGN